MYEIKIFHLDISFWEGESNSKDAGKSKNEGKADGKGKREDDGKSKDDLKVRDERVWARSKSEGLGWE